jgi:hypothetical protein
MSEKGEPSKEDQNHKDLNFFFQDILGDDQVNTNHSFQSIVQTFRNEDNQSASYNNLPAELQHLFDLPESSYSSTNTTQTWNRTNTVAAEGSPQSGVSTPTTSFVTPPVQEVAASAVNSNTESPQPSPSPAVQPSPFQATSTNTSSPTPTSLPQTQQLSSAKLITTVTPSPQVIAAASSTLAQQPSTSSSPSITPSIKSSPTMIAASPTPSIQPSPKPIAPQQTPPPPQQQAQQQTQQQAPQQAQQQAQPAASQPSTGGKNSMYS